MKRYLVLENGDVFEGEAFGASGEVISEIVFTTAMTGYLETLTDKSYKGQAVVQTFPLIGNYGVIPEDREGPAPSVSAYIVREACEEPSNFRCKDTIDNYLKESGIRDKYNCMVVGLEEGKENLSQVAPDYRFRQGDVPGLFGVRAAEQMNAHDLPARIVQGDSDGSHPVQCSRRSGDRVSGHVVPCHARKD